MSDTSTLDCDFPESFFSKLLRLQQSGEVLRISVKYVTKNGMIGSVEIKRPEQTK